MDEKIFNLEIRKFLKNFGITAQSEIEKKVREALANNSIKEDENLEVEANLSIKKINLILIKRKKFLAILFSIFF